MNQDEGNVIQLSAAYFAGYDTFYALENAIFVYYSKTRRYLHTL